MSELERRRDAREVWVSRSHLHAAVALSVVGAVVTFGFGYLVGRQVAFSSVEQEQAARTLVGHVPGRDLLALLAEVERSAVSHASQAVVYPELLRGEADLMVPEPLPIVPADAVVPAPAVVPDVQADPPPMGAYTIEVGRYPAGADAAAVRAHLMGRGLPAWLAVELIAGAPTFVVSVGGFGDEAAATTALADVGDAAQAAPVSGAEPTVVPVVR